MCIIGVALFISIDEKDSMKPSYAKFASCTFHYIFRKQLLTADGVLCLFCGWLNQSCTTLLCNCVFMSGPLRRVLYVVVK